MRLPERRQRKFRFLFRTRCFGLVSRSKLTIGLRCRLTKMKDKNMKKNLLINFLVIAFLARGALADVATSCFDYSSPGECGDHYGCIWINSGYGEGCEPSGALDGSSGFNKMTDGANPEVSNLEEKQDGVNALRLECIGPICSTTDSEGHVTQYCCRY